MAQYRLENDDCLEILPTIPTASIDLVITDPPYILSAGSTLHQSGKTGTWSDMMNSARWYAEWYKQVWRVLKPSGAFWTFCNWRTLPVVLKAAMESKIGVQSLLVWDKKWIGPGGQQGLRPRYENVALMCKENFQIRDRSTDDIWDILWSANKPSGHPAEKPVALISRILEVCELPEGATVLDPFAGSGTTGIACMEYGYNFIGCEQDPEFYKLAEGRVQAAASQGQKFVSKITAPHNNPMQATFLRSAAESA